MLTGEGLKLLLAAEARTSRLRIHYAPDSRKTVGRGFPDLVIGGPGGVAFVECKGWRENLTEDQWAWRYLLIGAGADHRVLRPADHDSGQIRDLLLRLALG